MFKRNLILFTITLLLYPSLYNAECCKSYLVSFTSRIESCEYFGAINDYFRDSNFQLRSNNAQRCVIRVCGDGSLIEERKYCGKGTYCNIHGCHCNEGCIKGNATRNFEELHKYDVLNVKGDY